MTLPRSALFVALAGALLATDAAGQTPLPPSISQGRTGESGPVKKPAPKPRPKAQKPAAAATSPGGNAKPGERPGTARAAPKPAPGRGYSETLPMPRKIDRGDIDDPYGSSSPDPFGSRMRPSVTPSGGMGMGGRF
jgi:hypothetical protein